MGTDTPIEYTGTDISEVYFDKLPESVQLEILRCSGDGVAVLPGYGAHRVMSDAMFYGDNAFAYKKS